MKLSEAIRLGAMLGPQRFGDPVDADSGGSLCAMEAAKAATGRDVAASSREAWPWIDAPARCPVGCDGAGRYYASRQGMIFHLNDDHRWTREAIADWVESIEQTLSPSEQTKETINV